MEDLKRVARLYYKQPNIQKAIASYAANREVVPRYTESFGKRPDVVEYPNDIAALAEKGATSFHFSEELWRNPLELSTSLTPAQVSSLRIGWDLILDVDSKFIECSKETAILIIEALKFYNIQNVGLKFSGRAGWHILIPSAAFPEELNGIKLKDFFPEGPRIVSSYIRSLIEKSLREKLLEMFDPKELSQRLNKPVEDFYNKNKFNPFLVVDIDSVAISPRHLIRMPYSLNEKSGLASIVINPDQISQFHPAWAKPERVYPLTFFPKQVEKNEAQELMLQALDWHKTEENSKQSLTQKAYQTYQNPNDPNSQNRPKTDFTVKDNSPEMWPPCIHNAMKGMKDDGRKRCLFILLNFFRSINLSDQQVTEKIIEWNKKNGQPLKDGYILAQLKWHFRNKSMLPPNCEKIKTMYGDLGICTPEPFCSRIKNPAHYTSLKSRIKTEGDKQQKQKPKRKSQAKEQGETREFRGRYY